MIFYNRQACSTYMYQQQMMRLRPLGCKNQLKLMAHQVSSPQIWHNLHSGSDDLFAAKENASSALGVPISVRLAQVKWLYRECQRAGSNID